MSIPNMTSPFPRKLWPRVDTERFADHVISHLISSCNNGTIFLCSLVGCEETTPEEDCAISRAAMINPEYFNYPRTPSKIVGRARAAVAQMMLECSDSVRR